MSQGKRITLRKLFFTGFLFVIPIGVSFWILSLLIGKMEGYTRPLVDAVYAYAAGDRTLVPGWVLTLISVTLVVLFILMVGALAHFYMGKKVLQLVDWSMLKIPIVRSVYGGTKQILDAFSISKVGAFKTVVLVEFPHRESWALGFLTNDDPAFASLMGQAMCAVFMPSTPNPTTGFLMFVRPENLLVLDMTIEEAIKLIISGGVVMPGLEGTRVGPRKVADEPPRHFADSAGPTRHPE